MTNVRYLTVEQLPARPSLLTADLSFISIGKVLPVFTSLLTADGEMIALVKPQFEAGRAQVGKEGGCALTCCSWGGAPAGDQPWDKKRI